MAFISNAWDESLPAAGEAANLGDDKIRAEKLDTRERAQNSGLYWPATNAAKSGVRYISPDAFVANQDTLYKSDLATPQVYTTDTAHTIVPNTAITGTLTVGGNLVATQDKKRILTLFAPGRPFTASAEPKYRNTPLYMPNGYTGTITEILILRNNISSGANNTIDVKLLAAASAFAATSVLLVAPSTGASILSATFSMTAAQYGVRITSATTPSIASPAIAGGDLLLVTDAGGSSTETNNIIIVIELAW